MILPRERIKYDMTLDNEVLFNSGRKIGTYHKQLIYEMRTSFSDIENILNTVYPYSANERLTSNLAKITKKELDDIILDLAYPIAKTLRTMLYGIEYHVSKNDEAQYYSLEVAERITVGIITGISREVLRALLIYVSREYMFHYIRDAIVIPNIEDIMNKAIEVKRKDKFTLENERLIKLREYGEAYIKSIMILEDMEAVTNCIRTIKEIEPSESELEQIADELMASKYAAPDFVIDLFLNMFETLSPSGEGIINTLQKTLVQYRKDMCMTHTESGLKKVINSYIMKQPHDHEEKLDMTVLHLMDQRGLHHSGVIFDDIHKIDLALVYNAIDGVDIPDAEYEKCPTPWILDNFKHIAPYLNEIKRSGTMKQEDDTITITIPEQIIRVFRFRDKDMIKSINSVFYKFGDYESNILNTLKDNPGDSGLCQSIVIDRNGTTNPAYSNHDEIPQDFVTRIKRRDDMLHRLTQKYKDNIEVIIKLKGVEKDPIDPLSYVSRLDMKKSGPIFATDEVEALYKAMGLKRLLALAAEEVDIPWYEQNGLGKNIGVINDETTTIKKSINTDNILTEKQKQNIDTRESIIRFQEMQKIRR